MMKDPNQTASSEELSMSDNIEDAASAEANPIPPTKTITNSSIVKNGKTLTFSNVNMIVKETTNNNKEL